MNPERDAMRSEEPDPLLDALGRLPRATAAPDFTARVLARAVAAQEPADAEMGLPWSRGWTVFAASLLVVSVVSAWQWERQERRREWLGQVEALRQESETLGAELSDLRAAEQAPIVYLGGDDSVDLVLDLEQLRQARAQGAAAAAGAVRPVNVGEQQLQRGETL